MNPQGSSGILETEPSNDIQAPPMKRFVVSMSFLVDSIDPIHAQLTAMQEDLIPINMSAEELQPE